MPIYNLQYTIYNRRNLAALILRTKNYELRTAFTLVELMIVVAILGILAAIVLPEFQSQSQQAKEAAAKANLKILRDAIERYALDHNGVPPGYNNNDPSTTPNWVYIVLQLTENNKYLPEIPKNPFNNQSRVYMVPNNLQINPEGFYSYLANGWVYHPATKDIRLNKPGTDSQGKKYFDY